MADIERTIKEALQGQGVERAEQLTSVVANRLRRDYAGWLYIDRGFSTRNAEIRQSVAAGETVRGIAARHGLTPARVRQIVNKR